ncbi:hypothetical protein MP213Fo_26060 [Pseudochrobactrum sp. MP213Fo]
MTNQQHPFKKRLMKTDFTVLIGPAHIMNAGHNQGHTDDDDRDVYKSLYSPPFSELLLNWVSFRKNTYHFS